VCRHDDDDDDDEQFLENAVKKVSSLQRMKTRLTSSGLNAYRLLCTLDTVYMAARTVSGTKNKGIVLPVYIVIIK